MMATNRSSAHLGAERVGGSGASGDVGGNDGAEDGLVEGAGAAGGRELEPENKGGLEDVVEGEVVENHAESKGLEEVEEAKDGPVGEPG
jgi:hypothetical protein